MIKRRVEWGAAFDLQKAACSKKRCAATLMEGDHLVEHMWSAPMGRFLLIL
jgi:hypothetical protein